jgi:hypothetical protein
VLNHLREEQTSVPHGGVGDGSGVFTSASNLKGLSYLYSIFSSYVRFYTSLAIFIFDAFQVCNFMYLRK